MSVESNPAPTKTDDSKSAHSQAPGPSKDAEVSNSDGKGGAMPWLVGGAVSWMLAAVFGILTTGPLALPEPSEAVELTDMGEIVDPKQAERVEAMQRTVIWSNIVRLVAGTCLAVGCVFAGVRVYQSSLLKRGIVAELVCAIVAVLASAAATPLLLELEFQARSGFSNELLQNIYIHAAMWGVVAIVLGFTLGAAGGLRIGICSIFAGLIGAALGAVLYVIGATLMDPANATVDQVNPIPGLAIWLWASPALLTGIFLSRMRSVTQPS